MKKLIAVLTLFFAFVVHSNAQDKKVSEDASRADAVKLTEFVGLNATQEDDFTRLFQMKYKVLNDPSASIDSKKEMTRIVEMKIRATLNSDQLQRLDANPELFAKLTGANGFVKPSANKK